MGGPDILVDSGSCRVQRAGKQLVILFLGPRAIARSCGMGMGEDGLICVFRTNCFLVGII
jgi:hypothetical protein